MRGADKLLQPIAGKPILRRVVETALATGEPVYVTLPVQAEARRVTLEGLDLTVVEVPDAALGMSRSIVRALAAIAAGKPGREDGVMILPADMPGFTTGALSDLMSQFRAEPGWVWRGASADGRPGHPAVFPRDLWPELTTVTGDEGGRSVLQRNPARIRLLPLPGEMATLDLDTPEDWAAYLGRPTGSV
jgi:CTP:molybdopterin cytidylyltransferase MocA